VSTLKPKATVIASEISVIMPGSRSVISSRQAMLRKGQPPQAKMMVPRIGGIHPLQTFPSPDSSDRLKETSFAIESDNLNLLDWLKTLVTDLGGSSVEIESRQRPTYHASAVMACGLLAGLVGLAAEMWEPLGIDRDEALKRLIPLIRSTVDSLEQQGLPSAITGPFVRGDVETVKSHLGATDANSGETGRAYAALALASLHIARQQGGITDEDYESIKTLLSPENRQ